MNKKFPLLFLSAFILIMVMLFSYKTINKIYIYYNFSENAKAEITNLEIKQIKNNKYIIIANFNYVYNDRVMTGRAAVGSVYPNPWAATNGMKHFSSDSLICWFSPKKAEEAILVKEFPWHSLLSALILAAILLYFCGITFYLRKGF